MANDQFTPDERHVLRQGKALEKLKESPEWTVLVEILQSHFNTNTHTLLAGASDIGGVLKSEYTKGVLHGLSLAIQLPSRTVNQAKEIASQHNQADVDEEHSDRDEEMLDETPAQPIGNAP